MVKKLKNNPFKDLPNNEVCSCFFHRFEDVYQCVCFNTSYCPGKHCSHYKTVAQNEAAKKKCRDRILSLPTEQMNHIFDKYGDWDE